MPQLHDVACAELRPIVLYFSQARTTEVQQPTGVRHNYFPVFYLSQIDGDIVREDVIEEVRQRCDCTVGAHAGAFLKELIGYSN